jgi:hypothetical protein
LAIRHIEILTAYRTAMISVFVNAHSWSPLVASTPVNTIKMVAKKYEYAVRDKLVGYLLIKLACNSHDRKGH